MNSDGVYQGGMSWQDDGVAPPYYGAFAECYNGETEVCAVILDFAALYPPTRRFDAYVWQDAGAIPGNVLCVVTNVDPGTISVYPNFTRETVDMPDHCCTGQAWWVGYWPDWPGGRAEWLVGEDDVHQGCPYTNVAPGIGYPTGWQSVEPIFGPTGSIGIGAEGRACGSTPVVETSWGRVKSLCR